MPSLGLRARRGDLGLALGDGTVTLASAVASLPMRGVSFTWSPDRDHTYAGASIGVARPSSCCAFIEADAPTLAILRGGYGSPSGARAFGAAGVLRDPDLGGLLPLLRLGLGHRATHSEVFAELFHLGQGSGVTSDLRLSAGRFDLLSTARYTSRGLYLGRHALESQDKLLVRITPAVRITDRWGALANGSLAYASHPEGPARMHVSAQVGARFAPGSMHAVQGSYQHLATWEREESAWVGTGGTHVGELTSSHATRRGHHFQNLVRLGFRDTGGFDRAFAIHRAEFQATGAWHWGVLATGSLDGQDATGQAYLAGEVVRDAPRLYLRGQAGSVVAFGGLGGPAVGPVASGEVGWYPVAEHRLGVDGTTSFGTSTKTASWRVAASYAFVRGPVRRPDARAVGISGSIRGVVFEDLDGDGSRDPEEAGIPDIPVKLDGGRSVVTDEGGAFRIRSVVPGAHEVSIERNGWHTVDGTHHPVQVQPLRPAFTSFGLNTGRRILVRVFVDRDQNGILSNGDRGVSAGAVVVED
ncbi:MAG: hypothetical protein JRI25_28555, partial [Deltaproteobacteria bacterium]|nr:hypothetical protein [Deltaproteobacteria bacterium]